MSWALGADREIDRRGSNDGRVGAIRLYLDSEQSVQDNRLASDDKLMVLMAHCCIVLSVCAFSNGDQLISN